MRLSLEDFPGHLAALQVKDSVDEAPWNLAQIPHKHHVIYGVLFRKLRLHLVHVNREDTIDLIDQGEGVGFHMVNVLRENFAESHQFVLA